MPPLLRNYKTTTLTSDSWAEGKKRGASLLLSVRACLGFRPDQTVVGGGDRHSTAPEVEDEAKENMGDSTKTMTELRLFV